MKKPPYITWIETTLKRVDNLIRKDKRLIALKEKMLEENSVTFYLPQTLEEAQLSFNIDLVLSVKNSQEIMLKNNYESVKKEADSLLSSLIDGKEIPDFKMPFNDMVITIEENGEFFESFYQIFTIEEKFEGEDVYCIKRMSKKKIDGKGSMIGIDHDYHADLEFNVIKSKLPRIFMSSYIREACSGDCPKRVSGDAIIEKIKLKHDIDRKVVVPYCLKTPRTLDVCKNSYVRECFEAFTVILKLLERINRAPKKLTKIKDVAKNCNRDYTNRDYTKEKDRHYIEVKDKTYVYINRPAPDPNREKGTHASPVEHIRRPHFRRVRTKEGYKVIEVPSTIVNKGKKKCIYVIK